MIKIYPIDAEGERIGEDRDMGVAQWERMQKIPECNLRFRKSDEQRPSQQDKPVDVNGKTDGEKALLEIGGKPSVDLGASDAINYLYRLESTDAVERFAGKESTRTTVVQAREVRVSELIPNEITKTPIE